MRTWVWWIVVCMVAVVTFSILAAIGYSMPVVGTICLLLVPVVVYDQYWPKFRDFVIVDRWPTVVRDDSAQGHDYLDRIYIAMGAVAGASFACVLVDSLQVPSVNDFDWGMIAEKMLMAALLSFFGVFIFTPVHEPLVHLARRFAGGRASHDETREHVQPLPKAILGGFFFILLFADEALKESLGDLLRDRLHEPESIANLVIFALIQPAFVTYYLVAGLQRPSSRSIELTVKGAVSATTMFLVPFISLYCLAISTPVLVLAYRRAVAPGNSDLGAVVFPLTLSAIIAFSATVIATVAAAVWVGPSVLGGVLALRFVRRYWWLVFGLSLAAFNVITGLVIWYGLDTLLHRVFGLPSTPFAKMAGDLLTHYSLVPLGWTVLLAISPDFRQLVDRFHKVPK